MEEGNTLWTTPNILSVLRILLVPVFLIMILQHKAFHALTVFLVAGATDLLDGLAARIWHQKTQIGAVLDPVADKLLLTTGFVVLTIPSLGSPNVIPLWLTAIVVSRDVGILTSAFILFKRTNQKAFYPSFLGKTSTFFQVGVVLLVLFFNFLESSPSFILWTYYVTFLATVISGIHYTSVGLRLLKKNRPLLP